MLTCYWVLFPLLETSPAMVDSTVFLLGDGQERVTGGSGSLFSGPDKSEVESHSQWNRGSLKLSGRGDVCLKESTGFRFSYDSWAVWSCVNSWIVLKVNDFSSSTTGANLWARDHSGQCMWDVSSSPLPTPAVATSPCIREVHSQKGMLFG